MGRWIGRLWLAAFGLALVLPMASSAQAQQQTGAAQPIEELVVIGTRIRSPGLSSSSPITTLDARDIAFRQPVAVEELIRTLPLATPSIGPGTNNGSSGGATLDLRGLGPSRSLVLLDGGRLTPFDLSGVVDTNVIPLALIERVDLVTGGATVVYGADAITGVANFVLKESFDGVEAIATYGISDRGDAGRRRVEVTAGSGFGGERGHGVVSVGYTDTAELPQARRRIGETTINSTTGVAFGSPIAVPTTLTTQTVRGGQPLGGLRQLDPATGRLVPVFAPFNFNPDNLFRTPLERYQVTALARYEFAPAAELYGEFRYVRSSVALQQAATATFLNVYRVPIGNPFIPQPARDQICAARAIRPADCRVGNPLEVPLTLGRRLVEFGPRRNTFQTNTVQGTVGLRGEIAGSWSYDAYYSYGDSNQARTLVNWGSSSRLQQALQALDPTACLNPAGGCVPIDLFGAEGSVSPAAAAFIRLDAEQGQFVSQQVASVSATGDLGPRLRSPLADEPVGVAFGYEYRRLQAGNRSDGPSQIAGEVLGTGVPLPDRSGVLRLDELSAEVIAPLLSRVPWVGAVGLEAGGRYTRFRTVGATDYFTWKVGGDWSPLEDARFRVSYQASTRAPNVNELYAPPVTGQASLAIDPCAGTAVDPRDATTVGTLSNLCRLTGVPVAELGELPQPTVGLIRTTAGGNAALDPETARTLTAGLVLLPRQLPGLRLTVDYFDIRLRGAIANPSVPGLLSRCYDPAFNPGLAFNDACRAIGRSPQTGLIEGADTSGILLTTSNLGLLATRGFDFGAGYRLDLAELGVTGDWGALDFNFIGTLTRRLEAQQTPASVRRDCTGLYSVACGGSFGGTNPKLKIQLRSDWDVGDYRFGLLWRRIGAVTEEPGDPPILPAFSRIEAFNYFDLSLGWRPADAVELTVTVLNLFDLDPPLVGSTVGTGFQNSGNTFPQDYDAVGRYLTVGLAVRF